MELKFTKMHGCGNDYIYFDCFSQKIDNPGELSIKLSDRHKGIGGDGIVLICPSDAADAKMRMFNADGSEGKMCGNAIRCVGKYLFENGIAEKNEISVETLSGIKYLKLSAKGGKVESVCVNMGRADFTPKNIPVVSDLDKVVNRMVTVKDKEYAITAVSVGNPHCVVFVDDVASFDVEKIGPEFEFSPLFPERVNTEFIKIIDPVTIEMRVWERGSGETFACGTGACAAVAAACENGYCKCGEDITVRLRGGDLSINYTDDGTVFMTGGAVKVFEGSVQV